MTKSNCVVVIAMTFFLADASSGMATQESRATFSAPGVQQPLGALNTNPTGPHSRYRLRKGDVLELNFPFVPAFNQTTTVQPDGFVTIRELGPLRVDGMTVPELTRMLRAEYTSILRDPVLTVDLKDFEKPYFIVAGEVERPGKYDLRGETTVVQALAVAGGLKQQSKHSKAVVFSPLPAGGFKATQLDLRKMLKQANLNADLRLQAGDLLFIPRGRKIDISAITSSLWVLGFLY